MNSITIGLYTTVNKLSNSTYEFNTGLYSQIDNITKILFHTSQNEVITHPPLVLVYVVLVPGKVYSTPSKDVSIQMPLQELYKPFESTTSKLHKSVTSSLKVNSIYLHSIIHKKFKKEIPPELFARFKYVPYKIGSKNEYAFMNGLEAFGSFLDIVKARSITTNQGKRVLNMDSNTEIIDWNELYKHTFGQVEEHDSFGLSRCSATYIAFHNKFLYTCSTSDFVRTLKRELDAFFQENSRTKSLKVGSRNVIYDLVWTNAAYLHGYTHRLMVRDHFDPSKTFYFYPAAAMHPVYGLNKFYITVQRQSWRVTHTKKLPPLKATIVLHGITIHIDEWMFESLRFLYTHVPKLTQRTDFVETDFKYAHCDMVDYITLLNKQPNVEYLEIIQKVLGQRNVEDKCMSELNAVITAQALPFIDPIANEIRCNAKELPDHLTGGAYEVNPDQIMIEDAYDYDKDTWQTVTVTGGRTRRRKK